MACWGEVEKEDAVLVVGGGCDPGCCLVGVDAASGLPPPDFFQGWNPLPTAASASGGGLIELSLLHCAASIARGVPRSPGCSCNR